EKGLSLLGYHLCNYSLTKNVSKMVAYQKSYEKNTSYGGWIPWMVCPWLYYKTQYHTVEVPETITMTDCCEGYEQVGLYCSLTLNRSNVFASRPGICPMENLETSDYPCTLDIECPGLKKCCNSSKGAGCVDPVPEGRTFWYNITVLMKMDFNELIRVDSHLLNHTRLLHSMITGALEPLNASVHHIQSNPAGVYAGTVASQVLVGFHQPAPLAEVSSALKNIVKLVYEVIDTKVQDVNECSYAELNSCPKENTCVNLEGYYSCDPQHGHADDIPHKLSLRKEDPSAVRNHQIFSVTSNSFEMAWHVPSSRNHTCQVQVFKGKEIVQNLKAEETKMVLSRLEAGVMYSVEISCETCGQTSISRQKVRTEAKVFGVTMRVLSYNFTDDFHNASSSAYEEFSRLLLTELENSFPPNISALYKSGKLKVWIESLQAGSVTVRLRITVQDPEFPVDVSTFAPMLSYLQNVSALLVDQQNTAVEDWDECASQTENDCSVLAECINLMGSYLCRCKTTMDTNPSRPGRNCEGEIVNPLTETMAPETTNSTEFAPGEVSPAGPASPSTTEMVAALDSKMSTILHLPAALSLDDKRVPHGHSPTTASPAPWKKDLAPQMGFGKDNSPMAMGVTASNELAISTEQQVALSPSQQSSVAEASPSVSQPVSALTKVPMGTAEQEQLSSPLLMFPNQTASANTRSHTAFAPPCCNISDLESQSWPTLHGLSCLLNELQSMECVFKLSFSFFAAVQKLSGTVRITNVEYSPGFSNASSEEYQTFAQLFVDEIHKSLPLEVLQQMDAGLIKVMITGITNGSTVVSFNLLIAEDVNIFDTITTFCHALEHSSYFTVDKSSLSMKVTDQKPLHNTVLPVTSLQTSTHVSSSALLDFSTTEHKALENSSVVLPPLTMDPASTPDVSLQASPAPLIKPAQEVSMKDAVTVFCEIQKIILAIQKRFLQQESIPETSLYLGEPHCSVSISNSTHVLLQAGWSDCGTQVETNMTNTIVKSILWNDDSAQGVIYHLKVASPIHCVFQNDLLTSSGYIAEGLYSIFEDLHGSGHFRTEMKLFIGNSPIQKNFSVSASEDVLIEVRIQKADSKLKVVLTDCWATPTNISVDPLSFTFISNSCPIPNTYTTLLENGNSNKAQFKMKVFSFVNNSVVYLHCNLHICMETLGSTCRVRCHVVRSIMTGETIATHRASWGPLWKLAASDLKKEKEAGVRVGYIILITFAVFGVVLGVVSLLIFQYQWKMGRYNLRIKSDNFSYQVFYD
ncbi:UROL1 protein, partial [Bucco capensis]|nr:UROL1 protein [Bucco capensis]